MVASRCRVGPGTGEKRASSTLNDRANYSHHVSRPAACMRVDQLLSSLLGLYVAAILIKSIRPQLFKREIRTREVFGITRYSELPYKQPHSQALLHIQIRIDPHAFPCSTLPRMTFASPSTSRSCGRNVRYCAGVLLTYVSIYN